MRRYIDIIADYIAESILAELEAVPAPGNTSKEVGASDKIVKADMPDMLPHRGVSERNKPQAYSEIFAKTVKGPHNDRFELEAAPSATSLKQRRNNNAGIKKLTKVAAKGDATALLHRDYAGNRPNAKSIVRGDLG